ncbi:MAG UNVERIFIED_CONTAM: YdcF family protein [Anaerolineae bacterium]|jgi:uncharacterized SAM-binding protein YcdF (DUF218 family)
MLQAYGVQRITLVTTRYHMLRAYWMFNRQGLQVDTRPAPLDYLTRQEILYAYTREVLAFQWQFLRDRFPLTIHLCSRSVATFWHIIKGYT